MDNVETYRPNLAPLQRRNDDLLPLTELFYSLQGEGRWSGTPAVFIRLFYCNLGCVWCDSDYAWNAETAHRIRLHTPAELARSARDAVPKSAHTAGAPHLVITGGEPLLHQDRIPALIEALKTEGFSFIEIETNGTIVPDPDVASIVSWWNCAPKLSNSRLPEKSRLNRAAIRAIAATGRADFKFTVTDLSDIEEIETTFGDLVPRDRIYLMPEGSRREGQLERMREVAQACLREGYRFTPRLQTLIWDVAKGR